MSIMQMKKVLLAGAAATASVSAANAADMLLKAPPPPPPVASWAGWYIGAQLGTALVEIDRHNSNGTTDGEISAGSGKKSVWTGGGQIGYNWQKGNYVYGLEVDASTGSKQNFANTYGTETWSNRLDWVVTARARMGLAVSDTFIYVTSGLAVADITTKHLQGSTNYSQTKTRFGWVAGAGVEHMLTRNWTIGTEVLFMDLGSKTYQTKDAGSNRIRRVTGQVTTARTRLNYKF
jgi:outer membrane immunogenic protein